MKRLVTIGGGTGQSDLLRYLKAYSFDLSAIVSMVDDGGSTGQLRSQLGVLPGGDVRRCLVALARQAPALQSLMEHRFTGGVLVGHPVGNIVLAGLEQSQGNFARAVALVSQWLDCAGQIIPVTIQATTLYAELEDGSVIGGETNIDIPKHDPQLAIQSVYLGPAVTANPAALRALRQADMIVLTIGDLYTSVIPNLLVRGIAQAIRRSSARLVYTCNRTTKRGETRGFTVAHYLQQIEKYLGGRKIDAVIVDASIPRDHRTTHVVHYQRSQLERQGVQVVATPLRGRDRTTIDGKKLARAIAKLCAE